MFKKITAFLIILCVLVATLSSCGGDEEINVVYPISADPECLDPQIAETKSAKMIVQNSMEGLVRLGSEGEILPGVAKEWEISSDGLTYTFHLRQDTNWQLLRSHSKILGEDYKSTFNTKVTAADCAFGIKRALRPETNAQDAYMLYVIKNAKAVHEGAAGEQALGVEAVDENTLVIRLERKSSDFLRVLTYPMCMPCDEEFFYLTGAKYGLEIKYTLCNGPFYIGKWVSDGSLTLYKNEGYSGDAKAKTNAVYLLINKNEDQQISKFNQGDYNVLSISPQMVSKIKSSKDVTLLNSQNIVSALLFNCQGNVTSNENIRKALIHATDIEIFKNENSSKTFSNGVVPESCRVGEENYRQLAGALAMPSYDSQKAIKYFDKGLEELDTTNIDITILCQAEYRTSLIKIIQKWEKIFGLSITVSVKAVESEELEAAVNEREYQIVMTDLCADDASVIKFLDKFTSESEKNLNNFASEEYDQIIADIKTKRSGEKINKGYKEAEQLLIDEGAIYPLLVSQSHTVIRNNVSGVYGSPGFDTLSFSIWEES